MVALVAALLLASSSSPFAQEDHANLPPPDQVEILSAVRQYYEDLSARDWERFAANFWEGATIATVWQPEGEDSPRVVINTIPEFVAKAPEGPGSKSIFEETMGQSKILVYQNLAIAWVEYDARFGDPMTSWSGRELTASHC